MRLAIMGAVLTAATLATSGPAAAQQGDRAFCLLEQNGRMFCYYDTFDQCLLTMRGTGGSCFANPKARQTPAEQPSAKKKRR
jgi:hypothetical protein